MSSLSNIAPLQGQQQYQRFLAPNADLGYSAAPWLLPSPETSSRKRAKKRHSKRHKEKRGKKQRLGAYVIQLIGLICFMLAAFKSFEPLTGVGFTLVVIGYKGGLGKSDFEGPLKPGRKGHKKSKKRRRERRVEGNENGSGEEMLLKKGPHD